MSLGKNDILIYQKIFLDSVKRGIAGVAREMYINGRIKKGIRKKALREIIVV